MEIKKLRVILGKFQLNLGVLMITRSDSEKRWNHAHIEKTNPLTSHHINIDHEERAKINVDADANRLSLELRGDSGYRIHPYSNISIKE